MIAWVIQEPEMTKYEERFSAFTNNFILTLNFHKVFHKNYSLCGTMHLRQRFWFTSEKNLIFSCVFKILLKLSKILHNYLNN